MEHPQVSVLIPTYNRADFLPRTLPSVLDQTLPPQEVILVDDGSTDETPDVVADLRAAHPTWAERLIVIRQTNQGKSAALNTALAVARGEWIAYNDSDDAWLPDKLERQFAALERFPRCLGCFTETSLNEFNNRHPELTQDEFDGVGTVAAPSRLFPINWPGIYMQTVVVRSDVMRRCGDFDVRYRLSQDVDFLFRLGLLTPFCYVNYPLVQIDQDPARGVGLMTEYPARSWTAMLEAEAMLCSWLSMVDQSDPALRAILRHELASARSALANRHVIAGDLAAARRSIREGIRDSPEPRLFVKCALAYLFPHLFRALAARHAPAEFFSGAR